MQVTIFLDIEEANFLSEVIPADSPASEAIARALRKRKYWGGPEDDLVVECDDNDGLDLLGYAESYCPTAAGNIRRAFRLANLQRW